MSGGSWDYAYAKVEEVADRLLGEKNPLRRALGRRLELAAKALHAVEWVDSHDWGEGDDLSALREALGGGAEATLAGLREAVESAQGARAELAMLLSEADKLLGNP